MKKLYTILAIAAVAAVGCAKTEVVNDTPDVKIGFQVADYAVQTKANVSLVNELNTLGLDKEFQSVAYINAANAGGTVDAPVKFFTAVANGIETVKYNGSNAWEPEHTYYWPKAAKSNLDFFSWFDATGTPTLTYDGSAAPTLVWTNRDVALKDNVMYADAAWHYKQNEETYKHDGVKEGVPTLFHHALAQVAFTASVTKTQEEDTKNPGNYTFWTVKLSNVSIVDNAIQSNGDLKLVQPSIKSEKGTQAWNLNGTNKANLIWDDNASVNYLTDLDETTVFNTDVAKGNTALTTTKVKMTTADTYMPNNFFTVRPQAVTDGITLKFKYTIVTKYGADEGSATTVSTETIDITDADFITTYGAPYTVNGIKLNGITGGFPYWQMNHKYIYNIIINPALNKILYDPAVVEWETESNADQTVPQAS
jgi:hypothetical protein